MRVNFADNSVDDDTTLLLVVVAL